MPVDAAQNFRGIGLWALEVTGDGLWRRGESLNSPKTLTCAASCTYLTTRSVTCHTHTQLSHLNSHFTNRQGSLASIKGIDPWDGQDAKEEVADEFDLSDILNEEL